MYYLISILLGLIPEVLYFTLFLIYAKDIKKKKIRLFIFIGIAYFLCMLVKQYEIIYYILFIVLIYIILKVLYKKKTQIIDIFLISIGSVYLTLVSYVCFKFVSEDFSNYYLMLAINRILLFIPFVFRNKLNVIYKKYYLLWNRNDKEKRLIKSITLRNVSLILLNLFIFCLNLIMIYLLTKVK